MKTGAVLFFLPVLLFGFTSCITTREIVVDIYEPPKHKLPEYIRKVIILERIPEEEWSVIKNRKQSLAGKQEAGIRVLAGGQAMFGLVERLNEENNPEVAGTIEWIDTINSYNGHFPPPFTWKEIDDFSNRKNADAVISMENFSFNTKINFSTYDRRLHESRNKIWSKTKLYNVQTIIMYKADYTAYAKIGWRVYDSKTKQIIFEDWSQDSVLYEVDGLSRKEVEKKLPSKETSVEKAGYVAGRNFVNVILPSYQTVKRYYFGRGSPVLRNTVRLVKFREWEQAEKKWEENLSVARPKNKARLLYNLALVAEMKGDRKRALQYLEEAVKTYPNTGIILYRNIIKKEIQREKIQEVNVR